MSRVAMAKASLLSSPIWVDTATKSSSILARQHAVKRSGCNFHGRKGLHSYGMSSLSMLGRLSFTPALRALQSVKFSMVKVRSMASASAATAEASAPKISRPSVTWGIIQNNEELFRSRERVFEYLQSEGINTSQLSEIELPCTIEVVKDRLAFLRRIGLDNKVINNYPLMIGCSVKKNMVPVLDYLEKLGIDRKSLPTLLKKYPMVLHASVVIDLLPVIDYLKGLDIDRKDIPSVLLRFPDVLGFKLEGTMSTSIAYLISVGVNMREIGAMLTEYPEILGMRVASIIKPKVDFLIDLGLPKSIVARILERRPQLLGYSLNETMRPAVDDLLKAGIQKGRVADIVAQYPEILGQCWGTTLEEKIAWLTKEVKILPDDIPRVFEKLPQMLSINERLAMERVSFLKKAGFSNNNIAKMVVDCPQILALSIDQALSPSLDFLKNDMRWAIKELVDFPSFFTYSLETRIRPRYKLVAEKGIKCSLSWLLNCSDHRFKDRIEAEFQDEEELTPAFKMGGPLVVGLGKFGMEHVDADSQIAHIMHARERPDSSNMDYFSDRTQSEEEEDSTDEEVDAVMGNLPDRQSEDEEADVDEDFTSDEDFDDDSELMESEDKIEFRKPSASSS